MSASQASSSRNLLLRLRLFFTDPAYEKSFIEHYTDFYYRYAQVSLALGFVLILGDFLVDFLAFPDERANFYRVVLCLPACDPRSDLPPRSGHRQDCASNVSGAAGCRHSVSASRLVSTMT